MVLLRDEKVQLEINSQRPRNGHEQTIHALDTKELALQGLHSDMDRTSEILLANVVTQSASRNRSDVLVISPLREIITTKDEGLSKAAESINTIAERIDNLINDLSAHRDALAITNDRYNSLATTNTAQREATNSVISQLRAGSVAAKEALHRVQQASITSKLDLAEEIRPSAISIKTEQERTARTLKMLEIKASEHAQCLLDISALEVTKQDQNEKVIGIMAH